MASADKFNRVELHFLCWKIVVYQSRWYLMAVVSQDKLSTGSNGAELKWQIL